MEAKRVLLQPAYVLHTRSYRDTSLIVDIFSQTHGRLALVARGALGKKSALSRSKLQPFNLSLISWSGHGELPSMTAVESYDAPVLLQGDKAIQGLYLNELLLRVLPRGGDHPNLFEHYHSALNGIRAETGVERILRLFEKELLQEIGYGVILDVEGGSGVSVIADGWYNYRLEHGPERLFGGPQQDAFPGSSLLSFARGELNDPESLRDAKRLIRLLLEPHLGARPLQSRRLARAFHQLNGSNDTASPSPESH